MTKLFGLKKYSKIIFIIILFIVILVIIGGLYFINKNAANIQAPPTYLKGYSELKMKINDLKNDPDFVNSNVLNRFTAKLIESENPSLTKKQRYELMVSAAILLKGLYSDTNNPKLYTFGNYFGNFVKQNYPDIYKDRYFHFFCQDSTCADSPQPKAIINIIEIINKSDFADEIKQTITKDLTNIGYLPQKDAGAIFDNYASYAVQIRNYTSFTKTNANITISDEIYKFLQKDFPEQYKKLLENPGVAKYGIRDFNL